MGEEKESTPPEQPDADGGIKRVDRLSGTGEIRSTPPPGIHKPTALSFVETSEGRFAAPSKIYWLDGKIDDVQEYHIENYEGTEGLDRVLFPPPPVVQMLGLSYGSKHFHSFAAAKHEANSLEQRALTALHERDAEAARQRQIELDRIHDQLCEKIMHAPAITFMEPEYIDSLQNLVLKRERILKGESNERSNTDGTTDCAHDD